MTQPPDPSTDLPPEQEAVRRLLADARHVGTTPPEVVDRLDATLAALATERGTSPAATSRAPSPVVDLGARRRRVVGAGLLAAAAVVVAGVAVGNGLPSMSGSSSDAGSSAAGGSATSQLDSDDSSGGVEREVGPESLKSDAPSPLASYPTLSTDDGDLDRDLLSLRAGADAAQAPGASMSTEPQADCDLSGTGPGRRVLAQLDGAAGAVVFRRADGATQRVDLYVCGDPTVVRTLTLPAP